MDFCVKKIMLIVSAALLCVGLIGCGKTDDNIVVSKLEYESLEKYDVRSLMWGMSIEQIAAQERDCTIRKIGENEYAAYNVNFSGHAWSIEYILDDEGLSELHYRSFGDEELAQVYFDVQEDLNAQYGIGQEDKYDNISVTLWRTDSCDIELYKSSDDFVTVYYAPCGEYEYKFSIYDGNIAESAALPKQINLSVPFGEVLDVNETGNILVIKTKITPSFNNHATISQNFQNLEDLIINQGCSKYSEIQYWAVADMTDGSESKVVSFTAPESTIKGIKDGSIDVIAYLDEYGYLEDVYILPSLKE